jgi:hypothetical protein
MLKNGMLDNISRAVAVPSRMPRHQRHDRRLNTEYPREDTIPAPVYPGSRIFHY